MVPRDDPNNGDRRASYTMTKPQDAPSDATHIEFGIRKACDEWVLGAAHVITRRYGKSRWQ
jgi:hypothetical protein